MLCLRPPPLWQLHMTDDTPTPDYARPPGFMTLGTKLGNNTILIRVVEIASVCEAGRRGSLLFLRSGESVAVRENLGEVVEAMNAEAPD